MKKLMKRALAMFIVMVLMIPANLVFADVETGAETTDFIYLESDWFQTDGTALWGINEGTLSPSYYKVQAYYYGTALPDEGLILPSEASGWITVNSTLSNATHNFSDFMAKNGAGLYNFEVYAYDNNDAEIAYGSSPITPFKAVQLVLNVEDADGNIIDNPGCSIMLTVDDYGMGYSDSTTVYRNGSTAAVSVYAPVGYVIDSITITPLTTGDDVMTVENTAEEYSFNFWDSYEISVLVKEAASRIPLIMKVGQEGEDMVPTIVSDLNNLDSEYCAEASGTDILFSVPQGTTRHDLFYDLVNLNCIHEVYWSNSSFTIAYAESYTDMRSYQDDTTNDTLITESDTIYFIWNETIYDVEMIIEAPVCGTEVSFGGEDYTQGAVQQVNGPHLILSGTGAGNINIITAYWADANTLDPFTGTIKGGDIYVADIMYEPSFGYKFGEDTVIIINGEEDDDHFLASRRMTAVHVWDDGVCSGCGKAQVTVSFDSQGGTEIEPQILASGDNAVNPGNPERQGYTFMGWQLEGSSFDFGTPVTESITLVASWSEGNVPTFRGISVTLTGTIGLNFILTLPDDIDYSSSYMTFDLNGKHTEVPYDSSRNDNGAYKCTCYVNSIEMADDVTAVFHYFIDETEYTIEAISSVEKYIKVAMKQEYEDPDPTALIMALADYGHYAQIFLSELRGWNIGTDHAVMNTYYSEEYTSVQIDRTKRMIELDGVEFAGGGNDDVAKVSFSLYLDSSTSVYLYYKMADGYDGSFSAACDDADLNVKKMSDGRYRVVIRDIHAQDLAKDYSVSVTTDAGSFTTKVSAMSYVKLALDDPLSESETNLMMALYEYSNSADDYMIQLELMS